MTTPVGPSCEEVLMAALARMDGEVAAIPADEVARHIAGCRACQEEITALTGLHADLTHADFEWIDADLWPGLAGRLDAGALSRSRRRLTVAFLVLAVIVGWRVAQLLLDVPAPVVNSIVPLALVAILLRSLTRDPFAICLTPQQLSGGKTS